MRTDTRNSGTAILLSTGTLLEAFSDCTGLGEESPKGRSGPSRQRDIEEKMVDHGREEHRLTTAARVTELD